MPSLDMLHAMAQEQELTGRELQFVIRYLVHFNGPRAVKEAGYETKNPAGVFVELRNKPYIVNVIRERMRELVMESDEALARLAAIARADITDFYTRGEDGQFHVDIQKIKDSGYGFLVKKIEQNRFGTMNVEFYSATEAISLIARNLGLLKESPPININVALGEWAQFVKRARELPQPVHTLPPNAEEAYAKLKHDVATAEQREREELANVIDGDFNDDVPVVGVDYSTGEDRTGRIISDGTNFADVETND